MKMKTTNNLISKLFNPLSTSSTRAFGSLFCAGYFVQTFILGKFPQGLGTVLAFVLHSAANTFYQLCMKYMDQFVNHNVNLYLIGQHSQ